MKKIQQLSLALITASSIFICSCGPNDDKGAMDEENSHKEGAVDSTRIPNPDSSHAAIRSKPFHSVGHILILY